MAVKLQHSLRIDVPVEVTWEYDYASQDGTKPGVFHLIGDIATMKQLLEEALSALG